MSPCRPFRASFSQGFTSRSSKTPPSDARHQRKKQSGFWNDFGRQEWEAVAYAAKKRYRSVNKMTSELCRRSKSESAAPVSFTGVGCDESSHHEKVFGCVFSWFG